MAGVSTLEVEVELGVEAKRLWLAQLDAATSLPVASGGVVKSVEYEGGHGEVGSIKIVKFGPAFSKSTSSREVIEVLDHEKLTTTYSVVGGDLSDRYSLYRGTISFVSVQAPEQAEALGTAEPAESKSTGKPKTLAKWLLEYIPREGAEKPEFAKAGVVMVFKNLEAWLVAEPELYTEKPKASTQI